MRRAASIAWLLLAAPLAAHPTASADNPLVGTCQLEEYVDAPRRRRACLCLR